MRPTPTSPPTARRGASLDPGLDRRRLPKRDTSGSHQAAYRLETREVRSYEVEYVHALWHADLRLKSLNELIQAWLEQEYHRGVHKELATTPLRR